MRKLVYELANGTEVTTLAEAKAFGDYKEKMVDVITEESEEQRAEREARIDKRFARMGKTELLAD